MKNASDMFKDMPDGSEFVRGCQADDFDDMQVLRRRCLALEQTNGDLGEIIGVLKQERARLWLALSELIHHAQNPESAIGELETDRLLAVAREALEQIRIDK